MANAAKILTYLLGIMSAILLSFCSSPSYPASTARSYSRAPLVVGKEGSASQLTLTTSTLSSTGNLAIAVPTTGSTTLTIAGVAELTAATNQVTVRNALVVDTSTFVTDATNNRVGITTTTLLTSLHVYAAGGSIYGSILADDSADADYTSLDPNFGLILSRASGAYINNRSAGPLIIRTSNSSAYDTTAMHFSKAGNVTVMATDGLSKFNVEGGVTVGDASYVGSATYTAASGEMFLGRNLMLGTASTSGSALINAGTNSTVATPMMALTQAGSGNATILMSAGLNMWTVGVKNSVAGDPFVISGGASPTTSDLFHFTVGGQMSVGAGSYPPSGTLHIDATSTTALYLNQDTNTQDFIRFNGDDDLSAPGSDPVSSSVLPDGFEDFLTSVRVNVNGTDYWLPLFNPTAP